MENDKMSYNKSHPLLMTYLKTLYKYPYRKKSVYKVIYQLLWCHTGPQPSPSDLNAKKKGKISDFGVDLQPGKMGGNEIQSLLLTYLKTLL